MRALAGSPLLRLAAVAAVVALAAACSGGVNTTPVSGSSTASIQTSTNSTTVLPAITSAGATFAGTLASASGVAIVTEQISASPPNGVPALAEERSAQSGRQITATAPPAPTAYVTLIAQTTVTINAGTSVSFTLPQLVAGVSYYLAVYQDNGWTAPAAGPASVSGMTLTFSSLPSFTLTAGIPTTLALYSVANSASNPLIVSSTSLTFVIGAGAAQTVTVSEAGFSGTLSETDNCSGIATVSPTQSTSPYVATVTPVSGGSCTITFTDGSQTAPVTVGITNTGVVVNSIMNSKGGP